MIDVKFPIKVKDLAKVVDQANTQGLTPYEQILRDPNRPDDLKLMTSETLTFKGGVLIKTEKND